MSENKEFKVSKRRIMFVYTMCAIGAAIAPVEQVLSSGQVQMSTIGIAVVSFVVAATVASLVIYSLNKTGKFMQFRR